MNSAGLIVPPKQPVEDLVAKLKSFYPKNRIGRKAREKNQLIGLHRRRLSATDLYHSIAAKVLVQSLPASWSFH
jgi:hypothetical protein